MIANTSVPSSFLEDCLSVWSPPLKEGWKLGKNRICVDYVDARLLVLGEQLHCLEKLYDSWTVEKRPSTKDHAHDDGSSITAIRSPPPIRLVQVVPDQLL